MQIMVLKVSNLQNKKFVQIFHYPCPNCEFNNLKIEYIYNINNENIQKVTNLRKRVYLNP